jgi:hypothetical protein
MEFDLAFQLDDMTRAAYCIIFSEMEGRVFDFEQMKFRDPQ